MLGPTGIGVLYGRRETLERIEPGLGGSEMINRRFQATQVLRSIATVFTAPLLLLLPAV
jgi:selenocysteine lyase/cysteine desulfurase